MKAVRYSAEAIANLKRYGNMAARVRKATSEYAANPAAHANNVTRLVGSPASRMRVADYRLTQIDLSQAADISQPYLAQLENGQHEGAVSVYARLAKLLHVRIDDLVADASAAANGPG